MKTLTTIALAALVVQPGIAAPVALTPTSQWIAQSSNETCRVVRRFGTNDPVVLAFEQVAPRTPMAMMASGGTIHVPALRTRAPVTADFLPIPLAHFVADGAAADSNGHDLIIWRAVSFRPSGRVTSGPARSRGRSATVAQVSLETQQKWRAEALSRERETNALEIRMGRTSDVVRLETGAMSGAMGALRSCMDRQLEGWGLDPAVERSITVPPVAQIRPDTWLDFRGAPKVSLKVDELSPVTVRLLIDPNGKVRDCRASSPRDGAAFENALCANVVRNGIFLPARTAEGKAVASYLYTTINRRR